MSEQPSLIPAGHSSVMAGRQATEAGDLDYFPTPPWAARAGGELIRRLDPGLWSCWEPACGGGHMAHGLGDWFGSVICSDISDHGASGQGPVMIGDFLDPLWDHGPDQVTADWIVTNPPFKLGEAFVRTALGRARRGVAMLLRLSFREGAGRAGLFEGAPWVGKATFTERVPMVKGRWDPEASSATAYAWFIWMHDGAVIESPLQPAIMYAQEGGMGLDMAIPAGTKTRLSRPSDLVLFAGAADQGELLEAGAHG